MVRNKKGFTLIEIVIVLAIAALILAGILIAVQGAQKSRRDSQRRTDAGTIGSLLEEYAGNHNGTLATGTTAIQSVLDARVKSPTTGSGYTYSPTTFATTFTKGTCGSVSQDTVKISTKGRLWQVCMGLESGDVFEATSE